MLEIDPYTGMQIGACWSHSEAHTQLHFKLLLAPVDTYSDQLSLLARLVCCCMGLVLPPTASGSVDIVASKLVWL